MGFWNLDALATSYLLSFNPEGLLAAAGWPAQDTQSYFHPRFMMEVSNDLRDYVFSFLPKFKEVDC